MARQGNKEKAKIVKLAAEGEESQNENATPAPTHHIRDSAGSGNLPWAGAYADAQVQL